MSLQVFSFSFLLVLEPVLVPALLVVRVLVLLVVVVLVSDLPVLLLLEYQQ